MTARGENFERAQIPELERRVAGMVRLGTVAELDEANARVRIKLGEITTDWLPWATARSGPDRTWSAPEVGEQVVLAAPSGELNQAVVLGTIPQDAHPAPGNSKDKTVTQWQDGARLEYDRAAHVLTHEIPAGGAFVFKIGASTLIMTADGTTLQTPQLTVDASSSITLDTPQTTITGSLTVDGGTSVQAITSRGKDISSTHKHRDVRSGPDITGVPV